MNEEIKKIILLQIRFSGDDFTVYACRTYEIAHRIIMDWFVNSVDDINNYIIDDFTCNTDKLENHLWERDIGYWKITEQIIIDK